MLAPTEILSAIRDFMETGGRVLWPILFTLLLLWTLIIERYWYLLRIHPRYLQSLVTRWTARNDRTSWYARKQREALVAEVAMRLNRSLGLIQTLIALCPLLGLLGTVTGMIQVFDVMAITGTGNARAMASGVSMATIPTMAGMVAALSGFYFSARLHSRAVAERQRAADLLSPFPHTTQADA